MTWFYLTSFVILLGAEINAELEHQTKKDTTKGPDRPMGQRGAKMADTLGAAAVKKS
jgi:membrane protein